MAIVRQTPRKDCIRPLLSGVHKFYQGREGYTEVLLYDEGYFNSIDVTERILQLGEQCLNNASVLVKDLTVTCI